MKYIITGGGTGGHIYPAVAIAQLILKNPDNEVLYVGASRGMEKDLVPKKNLPLELLSVEPINKKRPFKSVYKLLKSMLESRKIIKRYQPDVIVGTGGYASGPMMYMGQVMKIDTYIHEQNVFPGKVNKMVFNKTKTVMTTFEGSKQYFQGEVPVVVTGLPIIGSFDNMTREKARGELNLAEDEFLIFVVGGTNGAKKMHDVMFDVYDQIYQSNQMKENKYNKIKVMHIAGKVYQKEIMTAIEQGEIKVDKNVEIIDFCENMPVVLNAADLVISRAGASMMTEIMATKTPSIIIPSPNVANNHQVYNAKIVEDLNIGYMIEEKNLSSKMLSETIIDLFEDKDSNYSKLLENCSKIKMKNTNRMIKDVLHL